MGANPVRIKQWAFGIATATLALAGALLIIVGPVEPTLDRAYIGRTFCVVVLAGLGSMTRHAGRRHHPRRRRVDRADAARRLLGAGGLVRAAAAHPRGAPARPVREMTMTASWPSGSARRVVPALALRARRCSIKNEYYLLRRLRGPAVHRARHRLEHPGRLCGLRELRHRRLLRRSAPTSRWRCSRRSRCRCRCRSSRRRRSARLLGFATGLLTLRLRGIFFSIATVALAIILETLIINWKFVGGATGIQIAAPAGDAAVRLLHQDAVRGHGA